jgi:hypothetical protein
MASGALHVLSRVTETIRGSTPATPVMENIPHSSLTGGLTMEGKVSKILRVGRHVHGYRNGSKKIEFEYGIEPSYGSYDNVFAALMMASWSTNVLKTGQTRSYHTYERKFSDLDSGNNYLRLVGCEHTGFSLKLASGDDGAIIDGTVKCIGRDLELDDAIITGETYSDEPTTEPMSSFDCTLEEGGASIAIVTALDFELANGHEQQYIVGSRLSADPDVGEIMITGNLTAQFKTTTLMEKFINETESSITATLQDAAGNTLKFDFPRIRYKSGSPDVSGPGAVLLPMQWQALYDDTDESELVITRTAAV